MFCKSLIDATWSQCYFLLLWKSHSFFWSYWNMNFYDLILVLLIYIIYFRHPSALSPLCETPRRRLARFSALWTDNVVFLFLLLLRGNVLCVCECVLLLSPNLAFFHQFFFFINQCRPLSWSRRQISEIFAIFIFKENFVAKTNRK